MGILYEICRLLVLVCLFVIAALAGIGAAINISELIHMTLSERKMLKEEKRIKKFLDGLDRRIGKEYGEGNAGRYRFRVSKRKMLCEDLGDTAGLKLHEKTMKRAKNIIRKYIGGDWKRVEDVLPEDGVEVLITYRGTDGKYYVYVDEYDHECGWATGWDDDIVAWKPMPEPYCPERRDRT